MSNLNQLFVHGSAAGERKNALLTNLAKCANYLADRGPGFIAGKSWRAVRLLASLPDHVRLMKLLSHRQCDALLQAHPRVPYKYLGKYVALRLPMRVRRSLLREHYAFLQRNFDESFLDLVTCKRPVLWQARIAGRSFEIAIDFPDSDYEGDLRLVFLMDGAWVYKLIFVFAAARDFGLNDEFVMMITNIQGAPDFESVKLATTTCHDIQPGHILMAAVSGLAQSVGISALLGFHETRQISHGDGFYFSYRKFFAAYGEKPVGNDLFMIRLPYLERPLPDIKSNHRARNLRKRQFKADLRSDVARAIDHFRARAQ